MLRGARSHCWGEWEPPFVCRGSHGRHSPSPAGWWLHFGDKLNLDQQTVHPQNFNQFFFFFQAARMNLPKRTHKQPCRDAWPNSSWWVTSTRPYSSWRATLTRLYSSWRVTSVRPYSSWRIWIALKGPISNRVETPDPIPLLIGVGNGNAITSKKIESWIFKRQCTGYGWKRKWGSVKS